MTSQGGDHANTLNPPSSSSSSSRSSAARKLQVQRSLSRDTITIHFSAKGNEEEEEEEEELYRLAVSPSGLETEDQTVVTAQEASEELLSEGLEADMVAGLSSQTHTSALAIQHPYISLGCTSTSGLASFSWPSEQRSTASVPSTHSASSSSSPAKVSGLPSKPFLSLIKSLSTEVESREVAPQPIRHRHLMKTLVKSLSTDTARSEQEASSSHRPSDSRLNLHLFKPFTQTLAPQPIRHRHLMKTLVKSLSTDTARSEQEASSSHRPSDSRLNLHLFKPFTQSRAPAASGDSKTAPSSPLTSPDSRSFFKVQEVEARIEDTKRRLSEVMCEPFQLLSKIIGEEPGGISANTSTTAGVSYRSRNLSSSASELSNLSALNGHSESNNNYCIKEEEDLEGESPLEGPTVELPLHKSPSLGLDRCFMSTLARQEDEEFCELYTEDFEPCTDTELDGEEPCSSQVRRGSTGGCSEEPTEGGEEEEEEDEPPGVPHNVLILLISLVYGYFVLPLPTYVCWVLMGVVAGFVLAILVVWLSARSRSSCGHHGSWSRREKWNRVPLDIKEPAIHKGWMNEIYSYDPETYHATFTHSVYVRLEGSVLRLSKPNRNIPRRATFNELKPDVTYVSQKIYDLTNSKIYLVPHSLARKRVWNKKYPICIELAKQDDFLAKVQGDKSDVVEEKTPAVGDRPEAVGTSEEPKRVHTEPVLYLFGRTGRDKEEWFRRMLLASKLKADAKKPSGLPTSKKFTNGPLFKSLVLSLRKSIFAMKKLPEHCNTWIATLLFMHLAILLGPLYKLLFEFPLVGLWFDFEISYNGSFLMTLETKMNLTRLGKKEGEGLGEQGKEGPRTYFLADSDEESSSAGSSDEEDAVEVPEIPGVEGYVGGHRPSKIMRFVDKITKSKYFQKATETEFIKKKIEEVSNTPLLLTVEVQECRGTLAVNIPPPPTDRIWYSASFNILFTLLLHRIKI
uniref:Testis expressed 2 n=1 Tax=Sinocyclocheilus anshuiensis TaxID=1608454 RepID=A0A671K9R5_9TELE